MFPRHPLQPGEKMYLVKVLLDFEDIEEVKIIANDSDGAKAVASAIFWEHDKVKVISVTDITNEE